MRIWDINPCLLCNKHLLAEHGELHGLWNVLTKSKKGYSHHPETLRWQGKLCALRYRHSWLVEEMKARGFNHYSPLPEGRGLDFQDEFLISTDEQLDLLAAKCDGCRQRQEGAR